MTQKFIWGSLETAIREYPLNEEVVVRQAKLLRELGWTKAKITLYFTMKGNLAEHGER